MLSASFWACVAFLLKSSVFAAAMPTVLDALQTAGDEAISQLKQATGGD
jgi:hypothetical protein